MKPNKKVRRFYASPAHLLSVHCAGFGGMVRRDELRTSFICDFPLEKKNVFATILR